MTNDGIPHDTIDKLTATWRSLIDLGSGLSEEQWKLPTELPEWTVQDNLSHLIGIERSLQGLPATDHRPASVAHVKNPIGEFNEQCVDVRRPLTGAAVLDEWVELVALRSATLAEADAAYFAAEAMTPTGPGTVADFLGIRVLDCWSHEQDMRRAAGIPGNLDGPSAEHTIDRLIRTLPIVVGKRAGTPEGGAVAIELTGPVERHLVYEVTGGRAGRVDAPTSAPLATVTMDSETFSVLALGRRPASEFADRITVDGDADLGMRVAAQLNMMI